MKALAITSILFLVQSLPGFSSEIEPNTPAPPDCIDRITSVAIVDPALDSAFFRSKDSSYPFHIIEHEDGHLENTLGGQVSKEEATKIEHTAKCLSSHQGEHVMSFCDAQHLDGGLLLEVTGGLPAYASSLTVRIAKDKNLRCEFSAAYPKSVPGEKSTWTITKKTFKMTSDNFKAGERLLGWLSVEFEETFRRDGKIAKTSHKIEGYVKPVISTPTANKDHDL